MNNELKLPAQLRAIHKKTNGKKKPKSLRKNVLNPLLLGVTVISLIVVVFFNIVFWLMLYTGVVNDLKSVSNMLHQVTITQKIDDNNISKIKELYKNELEKHSISYRMNLVILNKNGKVSTSVDDFQKDEKSKINDNLIDLYKEKGNGTFNMRIEDDELVFIKVNVNGLEEKTVFIYASIRSLWNTVKWGNRALFVIVVIAFLAFFVASNIIAHNISKPIKNLSEHMKIVGDGNFSPVDVSESSIEMQTLSLSINEMLLRLQAYHDAHTRSIQNLSHDLKTPLMSIGGYAEGIKYGVLNDVDEATDVIISESKRLTEIVEKMLILSDLDALHHPIDMVPINIKDYLDGEIKMIDGYAIQNKVKVIADYFEPGIKVVADNQLLTTIVRNLLSNAVRYAENTVDVKVLEEDEKILIYVADDGPGLTDEDLDNLFVRYYVGKTGHTGLGLSAAKSAAEYMGCTITGGNRCDLEKEHPCFNSKGAVFKISFNK